MQSCLAPCYCAPPGFSMPSGTGRYEANVAKPVEVDAESGRPPCSSVPDPGPAIPKKKSPERLRRPLSILVLLQRAVGEPAFERAGSGGVRLITGCEEGSVGGHRSGTPWRRARLFRSFDMTKAVGIEESSSEPRCYVIAARYKIQTP